mgnify:FL=1
MSNNKLLNIPLENELDRLIKDYQKCCLMYQQEKHNNSKNTPNKNSITSKFNFYMNSMFKSFLNGILLKNIPASLNLYPDKKVISCDVAGLMQHALGAEGDPPASSGQSLNHNHNHQTLRSNGGAEFALLCERKQFIEQVVESPCFADFLARHGFALHF